MPFNIGKDEDGCFCRNAGFLNYQNAEPEAEKQMQNIYKMCIRDSSSGTAD